MKYKYPRTYHLPFSDNLQNDDRKMETLDWFQGNRVIVSLKIDGENTTMARDYCHARSLDSKDHPSRHWVKGLWGSMKHNIPEGWRICGENCFAFHSIYYTELPSYFMVFGIYDENNICLKWDDMVEFCQVLDLHHVPVLYDGIWDEEKIKGCFDENKSILGGVTPKIYKNEFRKMLPSIIRGEAWDWGPYEELELKDLVKPSEEGYVVRLADAFKYEDHSTCTTKFVRKSHVQTSDFWMTEAVIPNKLKGWEFHRNTNSYRKV